MGNLQNQLRQLLNKSAWTNTEKQWLLKYLEAADTEDLRTLLQAQFETELKIDQKDKEYSEKILAIIHQRAGIRKKTGHETANNIRFLWRLAVASIIGLLVLGTYFLSKQDVLKKTTIGKVPKDIHDTGVLPGSNKATLTLANGSTIVLNDEQNGELAEQGNTKVLKLNGRITYQPADSGVGQVLYNTISTPRGGQYQVVLSDGTSVWLNSESSLRFPTAFAGKERNVGISGEAYFEVAKNKAVPFGVSVNGATVQVLGTHFNVEAYQDEAVLKTTLLEGAVRFIAGNNMVMLKPGQQAQLKENGNVNVLSEVDVDKVVAWKNGYFVFDGADLNTIAKQLSRWYDVEVVGTNEIDDKFYAEIPRNTKLPEVLHALELTGKVHFLLEGKKVIVKP